MTRLATNWLGLVLPLVALSALAAEPAVQADAAVPASRTHDPQTPSSLAETFDLHGANVRKIVRDTASSQGDSNYRIDVPAPRIKPTLAELMVSKGTEGAKLTSTTPRLPEKTECDGFWSCGVESLLGLDEDERQYGHPRSIASDQLLLPESDEERYDAWLSCQDTNNMLPTYERFEVCNAERNRPITVRDNTIELPPIRP